MKVFRFSLLLGAVVLGSILPSYSAHADGENIPITSSLPVTLTSEVANKTVPRGQITIFVTNMNDDNPNRFKCQVTGSGTCSYSLALSFTKAPENFKFEYGSSFVNCSLYDTANTPITNRKDWCDTYQQWGLKNHTFSGVKVDVEFDGHSYNLQASKILEYTFNTIGWPGGDYTLMAFSNAASYGVGKSNPISFSLPIIPKSTLACTGPSSAFQDSKFAISCTSSLSLSSTPINIYVIKDKKTSTLTASVVNGIKFDLLDISIGDLGLNQLQVVIPEQPDQMQLSSSNIIFVQINAPLILPTLSITTSKSAESTPAIIKITSDQTSLPVTVQISDSPNGPWMANLKATSGSTSASLMVKTGSWIMANFVGDSRFQAVASDPVQVLITPSLKCSFPTLTKSKVTFSVTCTSNISLSSTSVSLDYQDGNTWVSLATGFIKGNQTKLNFKISGNGTRKFRISSSGLSDKYSSFKSGSGVINIVAPASSKPSSNGSGTTTSSSGPTGSDIVRKSADYKDWYSRLKAQDRSNAWTFSAANVKKLGGPQSFCLTLITALEQSEDAYLTFSQELTFRLACEDFIKSKR
jgi:hypothetical protein